MPKYKIIRADNSKRVICPLFLIESTCVAIKNVTNLLPVMEKCDITAIQGRKKCKDKADKVGKSAETMLE